MFRLNVEVLTIPPRMLIFALYLRLFISVLAKRCFAKTVLNLTAPGNILGVRISRNKTNIVFESIRERLELGKCEKL